MDVMSVLRCAGRSPRGQGCVVDGEFHGAAGTVRPPLRAERIAGLGSRHTWDIR